MKVLLTFNESYAPHGAAVISGILQHSSIPISIVVLHTDISSETQEKIMSYYKNRVETIEFIRIDLSDQFIKKFLEIKSQPHLTGNIEPYLRLFAPLYIKDDGIFYLDCDTVINGDIAKIFYEIDDTKLVCGVKEYDPLHKKYNYNNLDRYTTPVSYEHYFVKEAFFTRLKDFYKMSKNASYMCDGIMWMNLKKWREENLFERLVSKLKETSYFFSADQDVLNSVLDGDFGLLSPKWNTIVIYNGIMANYTSEQFKEAIENPIIVHMAGFYKPWIKRRKKDKYCEMYWEYRKDTPWPIRQEAPYRGPQLGIINRIMNRIIKMLDKTIVHLQKRIQKANNQTDIFSEAFMDKK